MITQDQLQKLAHLRESIRQLEEEEFQLERRMAQALRGNESQQAGSYRATLSEFRQRRVAWREVVEELKSPEWANEQISKRGKPIRFSRVLLRHDENGRRKK